MLVALKTRPSTTPPKDTAAPLRTANRKIHETQRKNWRNKVRSRN
jgi:hypothetical protein